MSAEDRTAQQFRKMTETPIPKLILSLAAPTILSMLITSIYNLADTFFVGQISTSASGAVGVVSSLMAIIQALGFMLGHGAGSIISRSLGSQNTKAATRFASTSFFTALTFGLILAAIGLTTLPHFMMLLGSTETILPHACAYARPILIAAPLMMSSLVMNNILRYEGKASFAMIGLVTGGVLNMVLDPVFIFGFGLGTAGAGIATALSQSISFCILLSMFLRGKTVSQFQLSAVTRSPAEFGTILMTGLPSFGRQGLNSIGGMLLNIAARSYGDAAVAGMSIVSRIFMFIISVAIGTGQGFQPVAGFNYGARKYRRVEKACVFTMCASFCFLSVIIAACWFNAEALIKLFRDDPEVTAIALPAFRYQCFACFLQPVIVAGNMLFQSIGKSGRATFLACCRQGVFFIPLILTLPRMFGLLGIEICQPIADVLTFVVTVPFLFPFLHQLVKMEEAETAKA
ncbi:MATE family efflux transporter [Faecalibacterium hattorii]|uniref:MATE family efflux transporter n=1 Tax=Faecalibacterium hattorii TaxID=2935520 RepID=UPI003AAA23BA